MVKDAVTGEPIKGATVLFSLNGRNGSAKQTADSIVKKAAEKVGFD